MVTVSRSYLLRITAEGEHLDFTVNLYSRHEDLYLPALLAMTAAARTAAGVESATLTMRETNEVEVRVE